MVTSDEVFCLLKRVIGRAVSFYATSDTWKEVHAGTVEFNAGSWKIVIFNDCNDLDYIELVTAPDGRTGCFDDWCPELIHGKPVPAMGPVDELSNDEFEKLQEMCREAESLRIRYLFCTNCKKLLLRYREKKLDFMGHVTCLACNTKIEMATSSLGWTGGMVQLHGVMAEKVGT